MNILTCLCCPVPYHVKIGIGYISLFAFMGVWCTTSKTSACRTWYKFNQFRFRQEVLYFLIPRSFQRALPPGPPTGCCPWPAGDLRSPDSSRRSAPPNVKSWIRAWFGPYAYGPDQIRMLIWSDHTRMFWPLSLIWNVTVSILLISIPYFMIISTHCSNDPSYELGLNKLELYSVLGIVNCRFSKCLGKTNLIHTYIK
jgi:hypothetical protein